MIDKLTPSQASEFFALVGQAKFSEAGALLPESNIGSMPFPEALKALKEAQEELVRRFREGERAEEFVVDLSGWNMGDFEQFNAALVASDFDAIIQKLVMVVKEWPLAGKPSSVKAYEAISLIDLGSAIAAVNLAIQNIFRAQ